MDLSNTQRREKLLRIVPVGEIWGIGSRTAQKLNQLNIHSAWDLASQSPDRIQGLFNIVVARTVLELNGVSCIDLDLSPANKQQIVCSRSFSRRLTDVTTLSQALAEFCSRAAEKLRQQNSVTQCISIFIRTSPFNPQEPQYQRSASIHLTQATQDTRIIINKAQQLLKEVFKAGYNYQKCGVQLSHIQSATTHHQIDLFSVQANELITENTALMAVMDNINRRFPKKMTIAATSFDKSWKPKAELISPNYTTNWQDLLKVK